MKTYVLLKTIFFVFCTIWLIRVGVLLIELNNGRQIINLLLQDTDYTARNTKLRDFILKLKKKHTHNLKQYG